MKGKQGTGSKAEQSRGTMATSATASSLAKEVESASTADINRTGSNGKSRKDEHGNGMPSTEGMVCATKPLCYGGGQKQ